MKRKISRLAIVAIPILLLATLICSANARGGVFVIQPHQEAIVSLPNDFDNSADNVAGNVSSDGYIDFYVLSPNGTVLLCYNHTDFAEFKFYPNTEGICTIHMANNYESRNVTVNLQYGVNIFICAEDTITLSTSSSSSISTSTSTTSVITTFPEPLDWSDIVDFLKNLILPILAALSSLIGKFIDWLRNFRYRRWWNKKYKKPRTPSTILNSSTKSP